jgi:nitrogen fixation protein FixH
MKGPFTGRHMAAILVAGFGVIIAVNFLMAGLAVGTFGGVVVDNSYVASQHFNRWLDEADRSRALGWKPLVDYADSGRVTVKFTDGPPEHTLELFALARHPLGRIPDTRLDFVQAEGGGFISRQSLPEGRWILRLEARSGGQSWRAESRLP